MISELIQERKDHRQQCLETKDSCHRRPVQAIRGVEEVREDIKKMGIVIHL